MSANVDIEAVTSRYPRPQGQDADCCLTAYTVMTGKLLDRGGSVLVGDSLGMVLYGLDDTVAVTLDMMIAHGQAVKRGAKQACVIVDMPFGTYQESKETAFRNCARAMKSRMRRREARRQRRDGETIDYLVNRGIPVMGHVGLLPQSVHVRRLRSRPGPGGSERHCRGRRGGRRGGRVRGRRGRSCRAVGAAHHGRRGSTIGIGASPACDGQILVTETWLAFMTNSRPGSSAVARSWAVGSRKPLRPMPAMFATVDFGSKIALQANGSAPSRG